MNGPGHQLLAGPALALDDHGTVQGGDLVDEPVDALHLGAGPDDPGLSGALAHQGPQAAGLQADGDFLDNPCNQVVEFGQANGLGQVVKCAGPDRLDG